MEMIFDMYKNIMIYRYKENHEDLKQFVEDILDFEEVEYLYLISNPLDLLYNEIIIDIKIKDKVKNITDAIHKADKYQKHSCKFKNLPNLFFVQCVSDNEEYKNCIKIFIENGERKAKWIGDK